MRKQQDHNRLSNNHYPRLHWIHVALALALVVMAGAPPAAVAGCPLDLGNDSFRTATAIGATTLSMAIECAGDVDYYSFTATAAGGYHFMVSDTDSSRLTLIDWTGNEVVGSNHLEVRLETDEQVFLKIEAEDRAQVFPYLLSISSPIADCGTDPGNDTTTTATNLPGCGYTGAAIDCAGDLDHYTFQAPANAIYTWILHSNNQGAVVLLDNDGVTEIDAGWGSVSTSMVAGEHIFVLVSSRTGGDTFDYEFSTAGCTSCGADPGDDYLAAALEIQDCGTTLAAMDCAHDVDYYRFVPDAGADYTFETTGNVDTQMRLYDGNGVVISTDDDGGTGYNSKITYFLAGGQSYSVAINEYQENDTGRYDLVLSGCPAGCGSDPGNDYFADATPVASCTNVPADIDCAGDVDFYSFTAPNAGEFSFLTVSSLDTELRLYDPDGNVIATDDNSGYNLNGRIDHTLVSGLTYRVAVNEKGYDDTGAYQLEIGGCMGGCGTDPGNDTAATATPVASCTNVPADIDCVGDVDYYSFVPPNSGSFTFRTTGSLDTEMKLLDSNGNVIASDDDTGPDYNAEIVHNLSAGLTYKVAVNEYGNNDTGAYQLEITGCTSTFNCIDKATELNIQSGRFKISGAAFLNNNPSTFFLQNLCAGGVISNTAAAFYFNDNTAAVQEGFVSVRNICNGGAQAYVVEVASASTRRFWIDVEDTWKGISHRYENPTGGSSAFFPADRSSFQDSCNP